MVDVHEDIFIRVYHIPCIYLPTSVFASSFISFLSPLLFNNDPLYFCTDTPQRRQGGNETFVFLNLALSFSFFLTFVL